MSRVGGVSMDDLERLISGLARRRDGAPQWHLPVYDRLTAAHLLAGAGYVILVRSARRPSRWWCGPTMPASDWLIDPSSETEMSLAPVAVFTTAPDAIAAYGDYAARCRHRCGLPGSYSVVDMSTVCAAAAALLTSATSRPTHWPLSIHRTAPGDVAGACSGVLIGSEVPT